MSWVEDSRARDESEFESIDDSFSDISLMISVLSIAINGTLLICLSIEDVPSEKELGELAYQVDLLLKDVVRLSGKLMGHQIELPEDIPTLPKELSYWVASNLYGVATEQQALLETQNTAARLEREVEILTSTRNHLAARTVLKDTLT